MKSHDLSLMEPAREMLKLLSSEIFQGENLKIKILKFFHREKIAVQLQRMIKICFDQIS